MCKHTHIFKLPTLLAFASIHFWRLVASLCVNYLSLFIAYCLFAAPSTFRWMPESARWLIANGKLEEAQMYLKKCAKMNRTQGSIDTLKTEVSISHK